MLTTSARLLKLLALLPARRQWSARELAERLEVTERTVRNDIARLRALGYPVHATSGIAGGYRLAAGADLPPLLLSDAEAVAVAISLSSPAGGTVEGLGEPAAQALAKLLQVLPARLRRRVSALQAATLLAPGGGPAVDPTLLTSLAAACRDSHALQFDYHNHSGSPSRRHVEPHRLTHNGRRWFLLAWDTDRNDWRIFRVDRIQRATETGATFTARDLSDADAIAHVNAGVATAFGHYRTRALIHAPADTVTRRLPPVAIIEAATTTSCWLTIAAETPLLLALYLLGLDADFDIDGPPELLQALRNVASRANHAASDRTDDMSPTLTAVLDQRPRQGAPR